MKGKLRDDRTEATGPNDVCAMDFAHDQLTTGKKLRVLAVVDTFSRYMPLPDASAREAYAQCLHLGFNGRYRTNV